MEGFSVLKEVKKKKAGGQTVYGYSVEIPVFERFETVTGFYEPICRAAIGYAAREAEKTAEEYEKMPRESRASFTPGGFSLHCEAVETGSVFSVTLFITDCRGKRRRENRISLLWSEKDGRLLLPKTLGLPEKEWEGFFIRAGELYGFRKRGEEEAKSGRRGAGSYREEKIEKALLKSNI